jgi:integrase
VEQGRRKTKHSRDYILVGSELERFKEACHRPIEKLAFYCLANYGLRNSEFLHLTWKWLDLQKGDIVIPAQVECDCYECRTKHNGIWQPKTSAGIRRIPAEEISAEGWEFMLNFFKDGLTIPRAESTVWRLVQTVRKEAGITHHIYPHSLRATSGSRIASVPGMTVSSLTQVMGWTTLSVASRYIRGSAEETRNILRASKERVV